MLRSKSRANARRNNNRNGVEGEGEGEGKSSSVSVSSPSPSVAAPKEVYYRLTLEFAGYHKEPGQDRLMTYQYVRCIFDQNFRFLRSEPTLFAQKTDVPIRMRAKDKNLTLDNWIPDDQGFNGGMTRVSVERAFPGGPSQMMSNQNVEEDEEMSIFTAASRAAKKAAVVAARALLSPLAFATDAVVSIVSAGALRMEDSLTYKNIDAGKDNLNKINNAGKSKFLQLHDTKDLPADLVIRHFPLPLDGNPNNEVMIAISAKIAVANRLIAEMTISNAQFISYANDKKSAASQKKQCRASRSCTLWDVEKQDSDW